MDRKQFGKKGIFMTFIAISIIAALIIIFTPSSVDLAKDIPAVKTRVSNLNEYVVDLEDVYMERTLEATGTKAIIALTKYMEGQNKFLSNFEDSFKEVLLEGKINGQPIDDFIEPDIMTNQTYKDWISKTITVADNAFNINSNFVVNDAKVYQTKPWFLNVDANVSYSVSSETASWSRNVLIKTEIDIQRFDDPYYSINTAGTYANRINKSNVKFNEWDSSKVRGHIRYGTYTHFENSKAPSFIMRFTNTSMNSSCCGIESLVNPNMPSIGDEMESYADYLFFNHTYQNKCDELYNVTALWDEFDDFEFDFEHLVLYNLTSSGAVKAC